MALKRVHLFISGRVQMVTFRFSTRRKARELGVKGWVKNLDDGRVEMVAEGPEEKLRELVEHCKKGPLFAKVSGVEEKWSEGKGEFEVFEIRY